MAERRVGPGTPGAAGRISKKQATKAPGKPHAVGVKAKSTKSRSLTDYAKAHGCFLCSLDERVEIEAARAAGIETKMIARWLIEDCGYDEQVILKARGGMGHHFASHAQSTALLSLTGRRKS